MPYRRAMLNLHISYPDSNLNSNYEPYLVYHSINLTINLYTTSNTYLFTNHIWL